MSVIGSESGSERIPRSWLRGKRANGEHHYSLWIEDSPQCNAEIFNCLLRFGIEHYLEKYQTLTYRKKFFISKWYSP